MNANGFPIFNKRIYRYGVILSAFLIILIGVLSPYYLEKEKENWPNTLEFRIANIESSILEIFKVKQNRLLELSNIVKNEIRNYKGVIPADFPGGLADKYDFPRSSIQIFNDKEKMIAWTRRAAIPEEDFFPLDFEFGETYFYRAGLITYFSVIDTVKINAKNYYLGVSLPIEKRYQIQSDYYENLSLSRDISEKFLTEVSIDYSQLAAKSGDGRKYAFDLLNNFNNKIGTVAFVKPSRDVRLSALKDLFINIQYAFAVLGVVFFGAGLYPDVKRIKSKIVKIGLYTIYIAGFRFLLFLIGFPSRFFPGELTNSAYFASSFGYGIVRSPLELFITLALFFFVCIMIYRSVSWYKPAFRLGQNIYISSIILLFGTFLYLIFLRALGSAMRSIIFDSSLRYFREASLIPNPPIALMHLNALLLGVCSFLISISLLIFFFSLLPERSKKETKNYFLYLLLFFQAAGFIYDALQASPQGSWLIRILYILMTFLIAYRERYKPEKEFYSYIAFSAALIVALFFDFNNGQLERRTLKTSALELTRTDESRLQFLINEALTSALENPEVLNSYESGKNFDAAAFIAWGKSSLQREGIASSITLLDWQKRILGSFGVSLDDKYRINPAIYSDDIEDLTIYDDYNPFGAAEKYISGIIPVKDGEALLGYVSASLRYSAQRFPEKEIPGFLLFRAGSISNIIDFDELKIFDFIDGRLINTYGGLVPTNAQRSYILNSDFGDDGEAWMRLDFSGGAHLAYALEEESADGERVIVASVKEKDISWNLYNFFKIFFIDAAFISIFFIIIYSFRIKKLRELRVTFRVQLLVSFLLISILPMILLAVFYRNLTTDKNNALTRHDLGRMALSIERYINESSESSNIRSRFEEANDNLKIDYSVYEHNKLIYSSTYTFREIGLLQKSLNPLVYKKIFDEGYNEQLVKERVENYVYNSFYYRTKLSGREYIISVNDIFNEIQLPITGAEIDVFLIGSYSFASILVLIFSAILASRISRPIRRLTNATMSVASGDLSFEIPENKERGEIRDLVGGFNVMIRELKKGQAEIASFERESAWREMARQVAHEVKNPLTPMKLAIQHLAAAYRDNSPKFGEIFEKVIKTSISQIDILSNIASEFSAFARMPNPKMEKINLRSVIDDASNLFLEEKTAVIVDSFDDILIMADKDQFKRAFINLFRNSIQAGAKNIHVMFSISESKCFIIVSDDGRGIPPELREKVFEPNFTTKEHGMGLGLNLTKKIVESINGEIEVSETSEKGTSFRIILPI